MTVIQPLIFDSCIVIEIHFRVHYTSFIHLCEIRRNFHGHQSQGSYFYTSTLQRRHNNSLTVATLLRFLSKSGQWLHPDWSVWSRERHQSQKPFTHNYVYWPLTEQSCFVKDRVDSQTQFLI
jgi:hypothetical protein